MSTDIGQNMRFKQFISESRGQDITLEESAEWIKKNSKIMMAELLGANHLLYRGIAGADKPKIGDSSKYARTSANTLNYYTLLIDSSDNWKEYPNRSKSFICSTDINYAKKFGDVNLVFPTDNTVFGQVPVGDFWNGFSSLNIIDVDNMDRFNYWLLLMTSMFDKDADLEKASADQWRRALKSISSDDIAKLAQAESDNRMIQLVDRAMKRFKLSTFEQLVDRILDPRENGFELVHADAWDDFYVARNEYWFADEAVFIPINMKAKLLEILK